jgi:serine acetyltransferase
MRKYDIRTFLMKWRRKTVVTYAMFIKGFSWKTLIMCDIGLHLIPKSTTFMHPYAICINDSVKMGENCDIRQCVTLGNRHPKKPQGETTIGNNVFFGAGCTVLGDVRIGDNVIIGAGAIVLSDVPRNTTVTGIWKGSHGL